MTLKLMKTIRAGSKVRWTYCLVLLLVLMTFGCSADKPHQREDILGLNEAQVIEKLGAPTASGELSVTGESSLLEYQSSLYDAVPASGALEVKEVTWKDADKTLKVWFKTRRYRLGIFRQLRVV